MMYILGIVIFVCVFYVSKKIADMMQVPIDEVFRRRKLENSIRTGETKLNDVSSKDLIAIQSSLYTTVGVGGIGPAYLPSFDIYSLAQRELERRRNELKGG